MKVLVVDDSALMRKYVGQILADGIRGATIETARDGEDALRKIRELDPDVVTLDINMPVMDGLTCLGNIMETSPRPVVMVSSLTERDARATFEALALGAVDYLPKPSGTVSHDIKTVGAELVNKVRAAARRGRQRRREEPKPDPAPVRRSAPDSEDAQASSSPSGPRPKLMVVGVSTGGPMTVEQILSRLPSDFPCPIVVAQHMPEMFTAVFAQRLAKVCRIPVQEVQRRMPLEPGIYIAQGGMDVLVARAATGRIVRPVPTDPAFVWHPSVERLVRSSMESLPLRDLVGILLTGMGDDGAAAMADLHQGGGRTIAESQATSVVFGMPRELIARKGATRVLDRDRIASQMMSWAYAKD